MIFKLPKFTLREFSLKYSAAAILDFILIIMILVHGAKPAVRMISPVVSSFKIQNPFSQTVITRETFSFVPGLAQNKFDYIDFQNLQYLSFFDLPLTDDGQINTYSRGYASFKSDATASLIESAHSSKVKFLATLTSTDSGVIRNLLDDGKAQDDLISQAVSEVRDTGIDGVTIDFEPKGPIEGYSAKLTAFITKFSKVMRVAVAIPSSSAGNNGFYDTGSLSASADRVFVIAADVIVPESKNGKWVKPVYGYSEGDYKKSLTDILLSLTGKAPADKLVMERAWYGSGENYPLYVPSGKPVDGNLSEPSQITLDSNTLGTLVAEVPQKAQSAARKNIPMIAKALEDEGILDSNVLAYALATIEHETDGTFEPVDEISGRLSARRLGYEGGENFFGRGFLQLTHLRNYLTLGQRIGMGDQLAKNPGLASTPGVAAKILAAFFKDNNVANLASRGQFVAARLPINPDVNGWSVALLAGKYEI